ncbi:LacI family DNA-binding transcriptional regulator [Victivallis sp.]|uniref:LacI family DNA-binding transcriptional regulator n=1 Tax=Victivallis sp. TaxID=2049020 RepID=UPI003A8E9EEB
MEKKGISIEKIAQLAGCSKATVSRALSGSVTVSTPLRQKILGIARREHYRENSRAVAILISSHFMVGYAGRLCSALLKELQNNQFRPIVITLCDLELLNAIPLCGIIAITYNPGIESWWGKNSNIPLVIINQFSNHIDGIFSVSSHIEQGVELAVNQLVKYGHRRIGRIAGEGLLYDGMTMIGTRQNAAFRRLCARHGIEELQTIAGYEFSPMMQQLKQLLDQRISALIIQSPLSVPPVMHALKLLARRVPDELSVIAYSFPEDADFLDPPPCCIMEDFAEIAMQATLLLLRQLDGCSTLCDISVNYLFRYGTSVRDIRDSSFSD